MVFGDNCAPANFVVMLELWLGFRLELGCDNIVQFILLNLTKSAKFHHKVERYENCNK